MSNNDTLAKQEGNAAANGTDWAKLATRADEEIDLSDIPELTEEQLQNMRPIEVLIPALAPKKKTDIAMKPKRLNRTVIYKDPWVNLYVDKVRFPDGRLIERHHFLDFEKAAIAIVVENDVGDILLVNAYRYITNSIEWEVPGGTMEPDETILAAAARETWEESGYETTNHRLIYTYHPLNGIANQVFHVVVCQAGAQTGSFDRNEIKEVRWATKAEIRAMIQRQELRDGFSLTAVLLHLL